MCAPLCFTPRHIKEGLRFTFWHIFLASCWVVHVVLQLISDCMYVVDFVLLQNVRGSVIAARSLTTPYLLGGLKAGTCYFSMLFTAVEQKLTWRESCMVFHPVAESLEAVFLSCDHKIIHVFGGTR